MDVVSREEVLETIAVALVELRGIAQPREIAELSELELDARDAESPEQLLAIYEQARNLRTFCERRKASATETPSMRPSLRGRT